MIWQHAQQERSQRQGSSVRSGVRVEGRAGQPYLVDQGAGGGSSRTEMATRPPLVVQARGARSR